ncbi:MAG: hypothetical protein RJA22_289 [Verrucomicrobiota bacterium]|jgi:iron(III) transport system substrate-binding protein
MSTPPAPPAPGAPAGPGRRRFPAWLLLLWAAAFASVLLLRRPGGPDDSVVVYVSQDQVYAEVILAGFERETGLRVRAVYDSEAAKTVGLVNRLLAEQAQPRCDVYWGGEELRTRQLAARGVFRETNGWTAFGQRSRRLAVSALATNVPAPASLADLTNAAYRGRVALALPLFGTTATHFLALRQHWGAAAWEDWCRALAANRPHLADGNAGAARLLARGEVDFALTDSDDLAAVNREGVRGRALPLAPDLLLIPNTVAVIRGAPHPEAAQRLFEFLTRPAVAAQLVKAGALESAAAPDPAAAGTLRPDWDRLLRDLDEGMVRLQMIFRRDGRGG